MWYTATSASVTNGSDVVTITTGDDISIVQEKSGLVFEDSSPVEVLKAYIDTGSNKVIQLAKPWPYSTKTNQPLVAYPTDASFAEATAELRRVIDTLSVASTVEAQEGADDEKIMTPLKTKQAIDFNTGTAASKNIVTSTTDTTAGRLLTVGYGGWGSENAGPSVGVDFGDVRLPMMVIPVEISESTGDLPESSGFGTLLPIAGVQNSTSHQWYFSRSSSELNKILFRTKRSTATPYEDWVEMYHSGNTNFNEFGGDGGDDWIAHGWTRSSVNCYIVLPINSKTSPTSITVEGTFKIISRAGNSVISSGISDIIMRPQSSNKAVFLQVNPLDSVPVDEPIILSTDSSDAKITVNF